MNEKPLKLHEQHFMDEYPIVKGLLEEQERRDVAWSDNLLSELKWKHAGWKAPIYYKLAIGLLNLARDFQIFSEGYSDLESIIAIRERQVQSNPASTKYRYKLTELYLLTQQDEKALAQAVQMIDLRFKLKPSFKDRVLDRILAFLERVDTKLAQEGYRCSEENDKDTQEDDKLYGTIIAVVGNVLNGDFEKAAKEAEMFLELWPSSPEVEFLLGDIKKIQGRGVQAHFTHMHSLYQEAIQQSPQIAFYTESRNKIFRLEWKDFPAGVMYIKQYGDRKSMLNDEENTRIFYQYLGPCVQSVLPAVGFEDNELVFRSAGEATLLDKINKSSRTERVRLLNEASRLLAKIHVFGTKLHERGPPPTSELYEGGNIEDVIDTDDEYFIHRIENTLFRYCEEDSAFSISPNTKERLLDVYTLINDALAEARRDFYKDHNPRNVIIDCLGNAIAIDFESSKLLPCQIDLVSLLEFGCDYLNERQKRKIIETYLCEKERLLKMQVERSEFWQVYGYARVHRHLEMVGYRSRDYCLAKEGKTQKTELRRRQHHLKNAADAARLLVEREEEHRKTKGLVELCASIVRIYEEDLKSNSH